MANNLEKLLAEANARLAEEEDQIARNFEILEQRKADNEKLITTLACNLLPVPVREFTKISSHDLPGEEYHLAILLPGDVAPIDLTVYVSYDQDGNVKEVSAHYSPRNGLHTYQVGKYDRYLDETEGIYKLCMRGMLYLGYDYFAEALVGAIRNGNNKAAVETEIQAANHKLAAEVGTEIKALVLQCPLTIMVEGEQGDCVGSRCAWWMADRGIDPGCAIYVLARGWARSD